MSAGKRRDVSNSTNLGKSRKASNSRNTIKRRDASNSRKASNFENIIKEGTPAIAGMQTRARTPVTCSKDPCNSTSNDRDASNREDACFQI
jgi:hypothetical protein